MFVEQQSTNNVPPGPSSSSNPGPAGYSSATMLHSDPSLPSIAVDSGGLDDRHSSASGGFFSERNNLSGDTSPYEMSPWNQTGSPYSKSPWSAHFPPQPSNNFNDDSAIFAPPTALIGSLVREEGHIYSLATSGDLLYTGSDSKNIRVWKNQKEYSGFKSNSGLVKAIVICADKIFSGHQDGKIRVWRVSSKNPTVHKRAGTLPKLMDFLKSSLKPRNYVEGGRKNRNALWIKHYDAVSCLSLSQDHGLLYSGSWDKTLKVWRISDSKCLESINAHDDAVNSVVVGFDGLVFTGSADGTVKVWQREMMGAKATKHVAVQTLLKQECAVTALAVNSTVVYCGSSDGLVNFWEKENQLSHGGVLTGHKLAVLCLASKGSLVLSGSADKTICMWKRSAEGGGHSCLSVLSGHTGPVKCLALEPDTGSTPADARWVVYSGSLDKSVKVWKVSEMAHDIMMQYQNRQSNSAASSADDYSAVAHHQQQPSSFSSPCIMGGGGGNAGVSKY